MKSPLEIYTSSCPFEESRFVAGGKVWTAPYLYKKVKELKIKQEWVNLRHLDLSIFPWGRINSLSNFIYHAARIKEADISIPIIIGWNGQIMDGCHRVVTAVLEGCMRIRAYRFEDYIEPDGEEEE